MQAITISISKSGVNFFAKSFLAGKIINQLSKLHTGQIEIHLPDFNFSLGGLGFIETYKKITVLLKDGNLVNFAPIYLDIVTQGLTNGVPEFSLKLIAGPFSATYQWVEHYNIEFDSYLIRNVDKSKQVQSTFDFKDDYLGMNLDFGVQFVYNESMKEWDVAIGSIKARPVGGINKIPRKSVLRRAQTCDGNKLIEATEQAIRNIDFGSVITQSLSKIFATIPSSGDLGHGIVYDFSIGDSGMLFPNNNGIQIGVNGGASYEGVDYSGNSKPVLPLPPPIPDGEPHHFNMFVSNYELDALHWAYFKGGMLDIEIVPSDLPDPSALKVRNYTALEPSLKPYSPFVMDAYVKHNSAPITTFQTVYEFPAATMSKLQNKLPADVNELAQGLQGSAYQSKVDLEAFLVDATIAPTYFSIIEEISKSKAMTVSQDLSFKLIIQNAKPNPPEIVFSVKRIDVMINLSMGINATNKQTLQYEFLNVSNVATFLSSTIKRFNGTIFAGAVWPIIAEPFYAANLTDMGKVGVPIPIMDGFQFNFEKAEITLFEGYLSIRANVEFK